MPMATVSQSGVLRKFFSPIKITDNPWTASGDQSHQDISLETMHERQTFFITTGVTYGGAVQDVLPADSADNLQATLPSSMDKLYFFSFSVVQ